MAISGVSASPQLFNQSLNPRPSNLDRDRNSSITSNNVNGSKNVVPIAEMANSNSPVESQFNANRIKPASEVLKIREEALHRAKATESQIAKARLQRRTEASEAQNERAHEKKNQAATTLANKVVDKTIDREFIKDSLERHDEHLENQTRIAAEIHGDITAESAANAALKKIIERRLISDHLEIRDEFEKLQTKASSRKRGDVTKASAGSAALDKSLEREKKLEEEMKDKESPSNKKAINAFTVQKEGEIEGRVIDIEI